MKKQISIARQPIRLLAGKIVAYELSFRQTDGQSIAIESFDTVSARVIINLLVHSDPEKVLGTSGVGFVCVDHTLLNNQLVKILPPERFVIQLNPSTPISETLVARLQEMKKGGYRFAIRDFDCTDETIKKWSPLLKLISYIKIDLASLPSAFNIAPFIQKLNEMEVSVVAEQIDDDTLLKKATRGTFNLYQGAYWGRPEVLSSTVFGEPSAMIVMSVLRAIKNEREIDDIEAMLKNNPDLATDLLRYLNTPMMGLRHRITSIRHALTTLGRDSLLKWLLLYMIAEATGGWDNGYMQIAVSRARDMEALAEPNDAATAYLTGMIACVVNLYDLSDREVTTIFPLESEIIYAVTKKSGKMGRLLIEAEKTERGRLKALIEQNWNKFELRDIIAFIQTLHLPV